MRSFAKRVLFSGFLVLLCGVSAARADFSLANWQFKKALVPPAGEQTKGFGEVVFDQEIFGHAKSDMSDIRIIDSASGEVSYVLVTEAPQFGRASYPVRILDKGVDTASGITTFVADLGKDGIIHNAIEIGTDSINFRRQVTVEGSADMQQWLTLASGQSIYDYTVEFKAQNLLVKYPDSTMRFLRIKIMDNGEHPLRILGATVYRETAIAAKEVAYAGTVLTQEENKTKFVSIATLDIGATGLPTSKLVLETQDTNFNREVALEGSNDMQSWNIVQYRDVLFSYQTPAFTGSKTTLEYPETNYRYFRLTIFNKDNAPIHISAATAYGLLRKLVFGYDPALTYAVYYGNPAARFPDYDLKNYLGYFDKMGRVQFTLASEIANPSYVAPKPPEVPLSERSPYLMLIALLVTVAIIGILIFRLFKRTGGINTP